MSPVTAPSSLPALRPGCSPGGKPAAPAARQPFSLVPAPRTRLTPGGQRLRPRPGDWAAVVTSPRGAGPARGRREGRVRGPLSSSQTRPPGALRALPPRARLVHVRRPRPRLAGVGEARGPAAHGLPACLSVARRRQKTCFRGGVSLSPCLWVARWDPTEAEGPVRVRQKARRGPRAGPGRAWT